MRQLIYILQLRYWRKRIEKASAMSSKTKLMFLEAQENLKIIILNKELP